MTKISILDCTLRDGGYITNWFFGKPIIRSIIHGLYEAGLPYIEVGYLNHLVDNPDKSIFNNINCIAEYLPSHRNDDSMFLAMADPDQFSPENITPYHRESVTGIRVVFYKHQIEKAFTLCESVLENGYKLFVQPMVTIDYTYEDYNKLIHKINNLGAYAVAIVDSFGYMSKMQLKEYFDILDQNLKSKVKIGFHSHNNMQFSVLNAESIFSFETDREIIIDASLYGMGRGAGNLNTELITNFFNNNCFKKYDLEVIIDLISQYIYPIYKKTPWGYSPYYYLTAMYHCHPNYAAFLLQEYDVSVSEFKDFLESITPEWRTKCRKPHVIEMYNEFILKKNNGN